jgi:hypothetical protein
MLQSSYDEPGFGFIRRQHYFAPLAITAPATPLAPAFYAEHLLDETDNHLVTSKRSIRCLFAAAVSTSGQRQNRAHLLDVITSHALPCRVGSIYPGPSKVMSIVVDDVNSGDEAEPPVFDTSRSTVADVFDVPLASQAVRAPKTVNAYVEMLRNTAVVLCPAGDDLETFRFWETLAAGAIPVIVVGQNQTDIDFVRRAVFGLEPLDSWNNSTRCPFPVLDSWDRLPRFLSSLFGEHETNTVDELQAQLVQCYKELIAHTKKDVSGAVEDMLRQKTTKI